MFDTPNSDDPTHSFLSKDHFGLILNEPAGNLAKIVITPVIRSVVQAWDDQSVDPRGVAETACEALFHPYWATGRSGVQKEMLDVSFPPLFFPVVLASRWKKSDRELYFSSGST